jgi:uncharacterized protein (TIGR02145 family)
MKALFTNFTCRTSLVFIVTAVLIACFIGCKPEYPEPLLPAEITDLYPARNITTTSATLEVVIFIGHDKNYVYFDYRPDSSPNWISVRHDKVIEEVITYDKGRAIGRFHQNYVLDINNLTPNTKYFWRVRVLNIVSEVTSSTKDFVTSEVIKPLVAVVNVRAVTNLKIDSVTLNASVIPNQENTIVTYEYKALTESVWQSEILATTYRGIDSIKVPLNLRGLQANTEYEYRLKANNIGGEVISSNGKFKTYACRDYDYNYYSAVTIGTQTWLQQNFRGTHFANGDPIPNITNPDTWSTLTTGAYCWYNNDSKIGAEYGGLYNWYVGADSRALIVGWHTPTVYEWSELSNFLGSYSTAGPKVMETGDSHWKNTNRPATNSSGFTALPNGALALDPSTNQFVFMNLRDASTFWASTSMGSSGDAPIIESSNTSLSIGQLYNKKYCFGLRMLKN